MMLATDWASKLRHIFNHDDWFVKEKKYVILNMCFTDRLEGYWSVALGQTGRLTAVILELPSS
jgi:hypothetical protein